MRFLANENFPPPSVRRLREAGHNVAAIVRDSPGAADTDLLARAAREGRIILRFDRDYGELIYRLGLPAPPGVIYFRLDPLVPEEPAERLLPLLAVPAPALAGNFTILERGRIRRRSLP